jgi:hypothetical protein
MKTLDGKKILQLILSPLESPVWIEVEWTLKKLFCVIKDLVVISRAQSDLTFSTICRKTCLGPLNSRFDEFM